MLILENIHISNTIQTEHVVLGNIYAYAHNNVLAKINKKDHKFEKINNRYMRGFIQRKGKAEIM